MLFEKPKHSHEDNIKVDFYRHCDNRNIDLEFEYTHRNCRFDAVAHHNGQIYAIIEIKRWPKERAYKEYARPSGQIMKYLHFNIPIIIIWDKKRAKSAARKLKELKEAQVCGTFKPKQKLYYFPPIWMETKIARDEQKAEKMNIEAEKVIFNN